MYGGGGVRKTGPTLDHQVAINLDPVRAEWFEISALAPAMMLNHGADPAMALLDQQSDHIPRCREFVVEEAETFAGSYCGHIRIRGSAYSIKSWLCERLSQNSGGRMIPIAPRIRKMSSASHAAATSLNGAYCSKTGAEPGRCAKRARHQFAEKAVRMRIEIENISVFGLPPVEFVSLAADLGRQHISTGLTGYPFALHDYAPFSLREGATLRREMMAAMTDRGVSISLGESCTIKPGGGAKSYTADGLGRSLQGH